jgi:hypothetical protein
MVDRQYVDMTIYLYYPTLSPSLFGSCSLLFAGLPHFHPFPFHFHDYVVDLWSLMSVLTHENITMGGSYIVTIPNSCISIRIMDSYFLVCIRSLRGYMYHVMGIVDSLIYTDLYHINLSKLVPPGISGFIILSLYR